MAWEDEVDSGRIELILGDLCAPAGNDDDWKRRLKLSGAARNIPAVDTRHAQIGDQHVERPVFHGDNSRGAGVACVHFMPNISQSLADDIEDGRVVVDQQNTTAPLINQRRFNRNRRYFRRNVRQCDRKPTSFAGLETTLTSPP